MANLARLLLSLGVICSFFALVCRGRNLESPDAAHKVYRVVADSDEQLAFLRTMTKVANQNGLNFWTDPVAVNKPIDIMVAPDKSTIFEMLLEGHGLNHTITIEDVKKLILLKESPKSPWEKSIMQDSLSLPFRQSRTVFDTSDFHSYDEIVDFMKTLATNNPTIASTFSIGRTIEDRDIMTIQISGNPSQSFKKAVWIDAGMHAREWLAHSTAIYIINELVTKYNIDETLTQYVDNLTIYVTPVANPDGYEFTRSSTNPDDRMWRKNRSKSQCRQGVLVPKCCQGVDLNRNFGYRWRETGSSDDPCEEIYAGTSAFSELESQAISNFVRNHLTELEAFITLHTYSQLWIHPYGDKRYHYPSDVDSLKETAQEGVKELRSVYGTVYQVGTGADLLYDASGGSDDWSKSMGIKYVYLLELRPSDYAGNGFIVGRDQILPTGRETWQGLTVVFDAVLKKNNIRIIRKLRRRLINI